MGMALPGHRVTRRAWSSGRAVERRRLGRTRMPAARWRRPSACRRTRQLRRLCRDRGRGGLRGRSRRCRSAVLIIVGTGHRRGRLGGRARPGGAVGVAGAVGLHRWPVGDPRAPDALSPPAESVASGPGILALARAPGTRGRAWPDTRERLPGRAARRSRPHAGHRRRRPPSRVRSPAARQRRSRPRSSCGAGAWAPAPTSPPPPPGRRKPCSQPFAVGRTRFVRSRLGAESSLMGAAAGALAVARGRSRRMTATSYCAASRGLLDRITSSTVSAIASARPRPLMADGVARGGLVSLFGSGHSILPVMDAFPRYGSLPGVPAADRCAPLVAQRAGHGWRARAAVAGADGGLHRQLPGQLPVRGRATRSWSTATAASTRRPSRRRSTPSERGVNGGRGHVRREPGREHGATLVRQAPGGGRGRGHRQRLRARATRSSRSRAGARRSARPRRSRSSPSRWPSLRSWRRSCHARGVALPTFVSPNDTRFPADHNDTVFAEYRRRTTR